MMAGLSHVEIFGDEPQKLAELYRELFGWQIEQAPGIDYWRIRSDAGEAAHAIGGVARRPSFELQGWLPYIQVASVSGAVSIAERHGGRVLKPRTAVPRAAWYAVLADAAGNAFAVWEPDPTAFPIPMPD